MHDSDDGFLESSEEDEDGDDLIQSPQRMPEPGIVNGAQQAKSPANPVGSDGAADGSSGSGSRNQTTGVRPSVAFQMQEMEGRPSVDDGQTIGAESSDDAGNTEKIIREYMVSGGDSPHLSHALLLSKYATRCLFLPTL